MARPLRDGAPVTRGFAAVALWRPKCDGNVGGAIRAASCFNARLVVVGSPRPTMRGRIERTDPRSSHRHMPVLFEQDVLKPVPHEAKVIAVEILAGARPLPEFEHPEVGYYLFGPEDGSLPAELCSVADMRVAIPTVGCLNLAMAVNVVLYDRVAKRGLL
jgi:tRNA(Leu) C34 or U34 (ribose-2'-O)-methylase TrmL